MTYSKKEVAQKLGLIAQNSDRINYNSLKFFFIESGVLSELQMSEAQYDGRRRRFNAVESQVIETRLLRNTA